MQSKRWVESVTKSRVSTIHEVVLVAIQRSTKNAKSNYDFESSIKRLKRVLERDLTKTENPLTLCAKNLIFLGKFTVYIIQFWPSRNDEKMPTETRNQNYMQNNLKINIQL